MQASPGRPAGPLVSDGPRQHILRVRLSPSELERIRGRAADAERPVSEWVRMLALDRLPPGEAGQR